MEPALAVRPSRPRRDSGRDPARRSGSLLLRGSPQTGQPAAGVVLEGLRQPRPGRTPRGSAASPAHRIRPAAPGQTGPFSHQVGLCSGQGCSVPAGRLRRPVVSAGRWGLGRSADPARLRARRPRIFTRSTFRCLCQGKVERVGSAGGNRHPFDLLLLIPAKSRTRRTRPRAARPHNLKKWLAAARANPRPRKARTPYPAQTGRRRLPAAETSPGETPGGRAYPAKRRRAARQRRPGGAGTRPAACARSRVAGPGRCPRRSGRSSRPGTTSPAGSPWSGRRGRRGP